jgi:hypothetical protein
MLERIRGFFWFCSGANLQILEACPTEYTKNAAIGASIFFTAVIASLSGGYAFFTVFQSHALAICSGMFWGMLIFNLDRFIVSSMRKESKTLKEFSIALPRLIIAFIISIVVVVPIELRLFQNEIHTRFLQDIKDKLGRYDLEILRGPENAEIASIRSAIESQREESSGHDASVRDIVEARSPAQHELEMVVEGLHEEIARIEASKTPVTQEIAQLEVEATKERDGLRPSGLRGEGPVFRSLEASIRSKQKYLLELERRIDVLRTEISRQEERIDEWRAETDRQKASIATVRRSLQEEMRAKRERIRQLEEELQGRRERYEAALYASDSFLTRVTLLGKLARENSTVDWVVTFIRLLVIALEISPILVKLLSSRGPYDAYLEAVEKESIVSYAIRLLEADDRYQTHKNLLQRSRLERISGRAGTALRDLERPPPDGERAPRSWQ